MKNPLKKIISLIAVLVFFVILTHLSVVPQAMPYEALTPEGGFYEVDYESSSLREIFSDLNCALNCFPHNSDTRRFNIIAIVIALSLMIASSISLTIFGNYGLKLLKNRDNKRK